MTIEEIFNKIASHMIEGIMYHDEMAKAYDFLGLYGFSKCHDYHHMKEEMGYRELSHYYATHYFKLLEIGELKQPNLIPDTWFKYTTLAVDTSTKRNAVKELMTKWVNWEKETKKLYEELHQELTNLREIAAAKYLEKFIDDVTDELKHAQKKFIKLETIGYDIVTIIEWQQPMYRKFKKRMK